MPYLRNDEMEELLFYFFSQGCNWGYGIDHASETTDVLMQEKEGFEEIYKAYMSKNKNRIIHDWKKVVEGED